MLVNSLFTFAAASVASAAVIERAEKPANHPTTSGDSPLVQFIFPPQRETDLTANFKGPCAGSTMGERAEYPLTGGKISIGQGRPVDNLNFLWVTDPTKEGYEFKTYGEPTLVDADPGHYCAKGPDFASLGFKAGDDATIMAMFQADGPPRRGTDKRWQFLCADVKLVDNWSEPDNFMCSNVGDIRVATADEIMNVTVGADTTYKSKGASAQSNQLSPTKAGGIGAGVTVGVFLLALGALWATGLLRFGKKKRVTMDDASSTSSYPTKQVSR